MLESRFNFYVPMEIIKSQNTQEESIPEMRIGGYASTSDEDRQRDIVIQKGLDISDFIKYGYFNFDHDNSRILGYPDKERTKIDSKGFYVEGVLLNKPLAVDLYDTAVQLQKSHAPRRLGFSVEGKVVARDSLERIIKAKVYNVAITANPVNPNATWDALVKSFSDEIMEKSVEAGYSTNVGTVDSGACLKPEDLESAFSVLAKALGGNESACSALNHLKDYLQLKKSIPADELVLYYQLSKGLTRQKSEELVGNLINITQKEVH